MYFVFFCCNDFVVAFFCSNFACVVGMICLHWTCAVRTVCSRFICVVGNVCSHFACLIRSVCSCFGCVLGYVSSHFTRFFRVCTLHFCAHRRGFLRVVAFCMSRCAWLLYVAFCACNHDSEQTESWQAQWMGQSARRLLFPVSLGLYDAHTCCWASFLAFFMCRRVNAILRDVWFLSLLACAVGPVASHRCRRVVSSLLTCVVCAVCYVSRFFLP